MYATEEDEKLKAIINAYTTPLAQQLNSLTQLVNQLQKKIEEIEKKNELIILELYRSSTNN